MILRDGSEVLDPRLDRLPQFDERSRAYPIRELLPRAEPALRSYSWSVPVTLNQGNEGSCVGHAWAHELAAMPTQTIRDHEYARNEIYFRAQMLDSWPGGAYPGAEPQYEGTSTLAGAKACQQLGHFDEYRWAFSTSELLQGLGHHGPAVLGIPWYTGMYVPDSSGRIRPTGSIAGYHDILAWRIVTTATGRQDQVWLHNSWGPWGPFGNGDVWVSFDDLEKLLSEQGDACFAVSRHKVLAG